jgi:hypothetical protein
VSRKKPPCYGSSDLHLSEMSQMSRTNPKTSAPHRDPQHPAARCRALRPLPPRGAAHFGHTRRAVPRAPGTPAARCRALRPLPPRGAARSGHSRRAVPRTSGTPAARCRALRPLPPRGAAHFGHTRRAVPRTCPVPARYRAGTAGTAGRYKLDPTGSVRPLTCGTAPVQGGTEPPHQGPCSRGKQDGQATKVTPPAAPCQALRVRALSRSEPEGEPDVSRKKPPHRIGSDLHLSRMSRTSRTNPKTSAPHRAPAPSRTRTSSGHKSRVRPPQWPHPARLISAQSSAYSAERSLPLPK